MPRLNITPMEKLKKVKGSAVYLEDGGVIFTPYNQSPTNSPWKKVIASNRGRLKQSSEVIQLVITVPRRANAHNMFMNDFADLMVKLPLLL